MPTSLQDMPLLTIPASWLRRQSRAMVKIMMTFYVDGGCKGNNFLDESKRTMRAVVCDDAGTALIDLEMKGGTNGIAELWALVEGMIVARHAKLEEVQIYTDSSNLIGWVKTTPVHL